LLIERSEDIRRLADILLDTPQVAVDTESNSLYAYKEQVCLVQFSITQGDYLVDPLAVGKEEMQQLASIFAAENIEKIFHAAEYDLICLSRDFGFRFVNLFDTMWAASVVGWEEIGLGDILERLFHVKVDKRYQRADWGKRPLSAKLLDYARQDTHYLIPLCSELKAQLQQMQRLALAQEDFYQLCRINGEKHSNFNSVEWVKQQAALTAQTQQFSSRQAAVLQELYLYRQRIAQQFNQPVYKIIPERVLLCLAATPPRERSALQQLCGLGSNLAHSFSDGMFQSIQRGLQMQLSSIANTPQKPTYD